MLNLDNVDLNRRFSSAEEGVDYILRYIYQLYIEANYRLDELEKRIKELEDETR